MTRPKPPIYFYFLLLYDQSVLLSHSFDVKHQFVVQVLKLKCDFPTMFLSAGTVVKFHTWPPDENDAEPIYTPSARSIITHASWCNNDSYLALLVEGANPEIVSTRDKNYARLVHTVQVIPDVTSLTFQKTTKKHLVLGTANSQVALYDTKHRAITKLYTNLTSPVRDVDCNADDQCLAAACIDGNISVYGTVEGDICETLKLPNMARPTVLRFHPKNPNHLAAASEGGDVVLWDIVNARRLFYAQPHSGPVTGMALALDESVVVSVGGDHKMCLYDLNMGECLFRNNLQEALSAVDLKVGGHLMAVGSEDGQVFVYDRRRLVQAVHSFKAHDERVNKIVFANQFFKPKLANRYAASKGSSDTATSDELNVSPERSTDDVNVGNNESDENLVYDNLKKVMVKALRYHISDLSSKINDYFLSLKDVMENEIATLDSAIDEKCLSLLSCLTDDEKMSEHSHTEMKNDNVV